MGKGQTFEENLTKQIIELALREDRVHADVTTNSMLEYDRKITAEVTAKEEGIISGIEVFAATFQTVDPDVSVKVFKGDGSAVRRGNVVLEIEGRESSILKAERTALNFLQRLSGIATLTRKFVDKLKPYYNTILLDTRKTTPGMRYLEKKAVKDGGGTNHRMNLEDMSMVKDNHIKMAGSISNAVKKIRKKFPGKIIEVEVKNLKELEEALSMDVDIVMLDNFNTDLLREAVNINNHRVKLEVSGNISLRNIEDRAASGIDFISVGAITHSFKSLDISLNISPRDSSPKDQ